MNINDIKKKIYYELDSIQDGNDQINIEIIDKKVTVSDICISCNYDEEEIPLPTTVCWNISRYLTPYYPFEEYEYEFYGTDSNDDKFECFYNKEEKDMEDMF